MHTPGISITRRLRQTPFSKKVFKEGVSNFTVYNHMLLPTVFRSVEEDYHHLKNAVQVWDVACERQVEITGPDAKKLIEMLTPRDLRKLTIDKCLYAPLTNLSGGIINDPVIVKVEEDRYWISIADSDVLLWVSGIATGLSLNVRIFEPDVSILAIQGPLSNSLMQKVFGMDFDTVKLFSIVRVPFKDTSFIAARSGFSKQGGFEIYVENSTYAEDLWDVFFEAGKSLDVSAGCPNGIERVEAGLLSYGNDMTINDNPIECGLENFCKKDIDWSTGKVKSFIGDKALKKVMEEGPKKIIRSIEMDGKPIPLCTEPWPVHFKNKKVGQITSAAFSPDFKTNVSLGMVSIEYSSGSSELEVETPDGTRLAKIHERSFI